MKQKTTLIETVEISQNKIRYDENIKKVLANKYILAWILKYTTSELRNCDIGIIRECIESDFKVGIVPVDPYFGIHFTVLTPTKEHIELIINVETQKDINYDIMTRTMYYCAKLVSSQKNTEFSHNKCNDIKKAYSIGISVNQNEDSKSFIDGYRLSSEVILGEKITGRYDILEAIAISIGNNIIEETANETLKLLDLLNVIFNNKMETSRKIGILEDKFNIPATVELQEGLNEIKIEF